MATDTDYQHHHHSNSWSHSEIYSNSQHPQDASISEILSHGSISFGRFAAETLAWEKWSVFSHNKCKEELEKFRAPGLVAEKKAYFEEYFRRARALKALQAQQQETSQSEPCQVSQNDILQVASNIDQAESFEAKNSTASGQRQNLVCHLTDLNSAEKWIPNKSEETINTTASCNKNCDKVGDETGHPSAPEQEQCLKESSSSFTPSVINRSKGFLQDNLVFNSAKINPICEMAHASVIKTLKTKGTVLSAGSSKSEGRTTKRGVKSSERSKPSYHSKISQKEDPRPTLSQKDLVVSNETKATHAMSNAQQSKVCSSSGFRKVPVIKDCRGSTSSKCGGGEVMETLMLKNVGSKPPTKLSTHKHLNQNKEVVTMTGGLRANAQESRKGDRIARKHIDPNDCRMKMKGRVSENQRPKNMSTSPLLQSKLNKSSRLEFGKLSFVNSVKQKEGESGSKHGKNVLSATSTMPGSQKTLNSKSGQKILTRTSIPTQAGRGNQGQHGPKPRRMVRRNSEEVPK